MPQKHAKKQLPAHLEAKKWKKGQSGNPGGRPKGSITVWNRVRLLLQQPAIDADGKPIPTKQIADQVAEAFIQAAAGGSWQHLKEIIDRQDGKVPDKVEHTGADGEAIKTQTTHAFDHDRFAALYQQRTGGSAGRIDASGSDGPNESLDTN